MAGGNVGTFATAAAVTLMIFLLIYSFNYLFESKREGVIQVSMDEVLEDFEDIESSYYLMEYLADKNASCELIVTPVSYTHLTLPTKRIV